MGIFDTLKYRFEPRAAYIFVELFGKSLDVDVHPVDIGCQKVQRLVCFEPAGDIDVLQTFFMSQLGRIVGIFKKDNGFVVGIGDRFASALQGKFNDAFRRELFAEDLVVVFLGVLGDVKVLAKFAGEVASYRSE